MDSYSPLSIYSTWPGISKCIQLSAFPREGDVLSQVGKVEFRLSLLVGNVILRRDVDPSRTIPVLDFEDYRLTSYCNV